MVETKFYSFKTGNTKIDTALKLLLISLILLIASTFLKVMYDNLGSGAGNPVGNLNIYGASEWAPLFLIFSLIEISSVINRREKFFIPLRIVNTLLMLTMQSAISSEVQSSENIANQANAIGNAASSFISTFTFGLYNIPQDLADSSRLLGGYHAISFTLLLSSITFAYYLYLRFVKKESIVPNSSIPLSEIRNVFATNKLLTAAISLMALSQFIPFNRMNSNLFPSPAFADHPVISSAICIVFFLIFSSLLQRNNKFIELYVIIEIASLLIWNPFYVLRYGAPGLGYIIYIVGLALLIYYELRSRASNNQLS